MALKPDIRAKQTQRIQLTPAVRLGVGLLRLSGTELAEELRREAEENPFLVIEDTPAPAGQPSAYDLATATVPTGFDLGASLRSQLATMDLTDEVRQIGEFLIGNLDEAGYLDTTISEVVMLLDSRRATVERALRALQSCEPAGIGARDLKECLVLQLRDRGIASDEAALAGESLEALAEARWADARRQTGLPVATLKRLAAELRELSPHPIQPAAPEAASLVPDLRVTMDDAGSLTVGLMPHAAPKASVDRGLTKLAKGQKKGDLGGPKSRAEAMIEAIRFRNQTLLAVAKHIVAIQASALKAGNGDIKPLLRKDIAAELGLHASTIGRAIAGKALEFQGHVIPLSRLLSTSLETGEGPVSALSIQHRIRQLTDSETAERVLSDGQIVAQLAADGVDIARRTVAKYRRCMNIPSSFERRRKLAAPRAQTGSAKDGASRQD